jgi:nitroreductase
MNTSPLLELIARRHCKRAFLDLPVDRGLLEAVLQTAANAPSSKNTQSWQVEILTGSARDELSRRLCAAFDQQVAPAPDYANRPAQPDAVLQQREAVYGATLLAHARVDRHDESARLRHRRRNFEFFDAPVELIFHLPGNAAPGNFLDLGCFMQNVALGLLAHGLGCCPQFSVASYSPIIHALLEWEEKRCVVAGMAVGHFDPAHPDNQFVPTRAPLAEFCQWHD